MVYSFSVSTPANTFPYNKQVQSFKATPGLVYHFDVYFPPGSSGLLRVAIQVAGVQIWPYNRSAYFYGDDVLFAFDDLYTFNASTEEFDVITYNTDTANPHVCEINIGIVSDLQFINAKAPVTTLTTVSQAIDNLTSAIQANTSARQNPIVAAKQRQSQGSS